MPGSVLLAGTDELNLDRCFALVNQRELMFSYLFASQAVKFVFPSTVQRWSSHPANRSASFSDTVDYQAVTVRDGLVVLSWQEHIGSTIVHTLEFVSGEAYTAVTPAKGEFMRLRGRIQIIQGGTHEKIVLSALITLDGCIAGPDDKMDWLRGDAQLMEFEQSFVDAADTLLLGRKTFTRSRSGTRRPSPPDAH